MASTEGPAIRPLTADNAPAAVPLSAEAGWNQVEADWRFMIERGSAFGVDGADGGLIASALVLPLGNALSWISMVLVTKQQRRSGLGTRLLKHCIAQIGKSGAVAGLDATELGRPIYLPLGFVDLYRISRYRQERRPTILPPPVDVAFHPMQASDLPVIAAWDEARSGMQRAPTLAHLRARQPSLAWIARRGEQIAGYVVGRDGRLATQIGPILADDSDVAISLAARAMEWAAPPYFYDALDGRARFCRWLEANGAVAPRYFIRMTLGRAPSLDDTTALYAIGGPELG